MSWFGSSNALKFLSFRFVKVKLFRMLSVDKSDFFRKSHVRVLIQRDGPLVMPRSRDIPCSDVPKAVSSL